MTVSYFGLSMKNTFQFSNHLQIILMEVVTEPKLSLSGKSYCLVSSTHEKQMEALLERKCLVKLILSLSEATLQLKPTAKPDHFLLVYKLL